LTKTASFTIDWNGKAALRAAFPTVLSCNTKVQRAALAFFMTSPSRSSKLGSMPRDCRAARGFPYCLVLQYQSPTLRVGFFYDQSLTLKQAWRSHLAIKKGLNIR
jgi:hypothetical protein